MKQTQHAGDEIVRNKQVSLLELLDRLLDKGVAIKGEILLSVANIDLIYLNLGLFLSSVKTVVKTIEVATPGNAAGNGPLAFWHNSLQDAVLEMPQSLTETNPAVLIEEVVETSQSIVETNPAVLVEAVLEMPQQIVATHTETVSYAVLDSAQPIVEANEATLIPLQPIVEENPEAFVEVVSDRSSLITKTNEDTDAIDQALSANSGNTSVQPKAAIDPENVEKGLTKLVLTLVDLIRKLMEKQAIQRIEAGQVNDNEIERVADTFFLLDQKMEQLKEVFGLQNEELNLDLGPLGELI